MVATECGAELTVNGLEVGRNQYTGHWESVSYTLCHGNHVGAYAEPLVGEESSGTAVAALYLVAYKYRSVLLASLLQALREFRCGQFNASDTLHTLEDYSADIAFSKLRLPCLEVIQRQISNVAVSVYRCDNFRIVCRLHSQ